LQIPAELFTLGKSIKKPRLSASASVKKPSDIIKPSDKKPSDIIGPALSDAKQELEILRNWHKSKKSTTENPEPPSALSVEADAQLKTATLVDGLADFPKEMEILKQKLFRQRSFSKSKFSSKRPTKFSSEKPTKFSSEKPTKFSSKRPKKNSPVKNQPNSPVQSRFRSPNSPVKGLKMFPIHNQTEKITQ